MTFSVTLRKTKLSMLGRMSTEGSTIGSEMILLFNSSLLPMYASLNIMQDQVVHTITIRKLGI